MRMTKNASLLLLLSVALTMMLVTGNMINDHSGEQANSRLVVREVKAALEKAKKSESVAEKEEDQLIITDGFPACNPPRKGYRANYFLSDSKCYYDPIVVKRKVRIRNVIMKGQKVRIAIVPAKGNVKYIAVSKSEGERNFHIVVRHDGEKSTRTVARDTIAFETEFIRNNDFLGIFHDEPMLIPWKKGKAVVNLSDMEIAFYGEGEAAVRRAMELDRVFGKILRENPSVRTHSMCSAIGTLVPKRLRSRLMDVTGGDNFPPSPENDGYDPSTGFAPNDYSGPF